MNKLCDCGCKKEVKLLSSNFCQGPYQKIHNGMTGKKDTPETRLKKSKVNTGKKLSEEHKQKIKNTNNGHKISEETKRKISQSLIGKGKGRKLSVEHRIKMSISRKKYIEENGLDCIREGRNEKYILDQIQNNIGIYFYRNDRKVSKMIKGKSSDGYSTKYNLIIEVLESHHFNKQTGELINYDLNREVKIAYELSCMIYYVPEQEFLKNPEIEIQRFKDFLLLLDEGIN